MDVLRTLGTIFLACLCITNLKAETSVGDRHKFVEIEGPVVFMQQPSLQVGGFRERTDQLGRADAIAVDRWGNFYVLDIVGKFIRIWSYYTLSGEPLEIISSDTIEAAGLGPLAEVRAIFAGAGKGLMQATRLYLLDQDKGSKPASRILMRPYLFSKQWLQLPFTHFRQTPHDLTVDVTGRLIFIENEGIVEVLLPDGSGHDTRFGDHGVLDLQAIDGHDVSSVLAIDSDDEGNIYVADGDHGRIIQLDPRGKFIRVFGSRGAGKHQFRGYIEGVAVDWRGNVYGRDESDGMYLVFAPNGRFLTRLDVSGFDPQLQLNVSNYVIDKLSHRFIIADNDTHRVSIHKMTRGHFLSRIFTRHDNAKFSALNPTHLDRDGLTEHNHGKTASDAKEIPAPLGTQ